MRKIVCVIVSVLFAGGSAFAEPLKTTDPLYSEMLRLDSEVFERGFNQCELSVYDEIIAEDFEFYHDLGGPSYGRAKFVDDMQNGICQSDWSPKRRLVKDSVSVFPLYSNGELYGALVNGEHEFYETPPGGVERKTGRALFSMFWMKQDEQWRLKRTFSYDHSPAETD